MQSRRKLLLMLTACCAAFCFVVASVLADELLGVLTKVDVEGKKITVVGKDEKKVEIKVNDETEYPTKKDTKYDLKKLEEAVEKAAEKNKKVSVKVTYEKDVASKIEFQKRKGGGKKKQDN